MDPVYCCSGDSIEEIKAGIDQYQSNVLHYKEQLAL
jgi:hypothetical protein